MEESSPHSDSSSPQGTGLEAETYWKVGKVLGAQGVRGDIFVLIFAGEAEWLDELDVAHFAGEAWQGEPQSYPVTQKRIHHKQGKMGIVLALEGLADRDEAERVLKGSYLYIPDSYLRTEPGETPYLREYLDFKVLDPKGGTLGKIVGFDFNGAQDLLKVQSEEGTHLVPLVKEWVLEVRQDKMEMVMDLPEGLLGDD